MYSSRLPERRDTSSPLLALCLIAMAVLALGAIITSAHAAQHAEANDIRNCNNIVEIWLNKSCERFNVLKQLDDGKTADHVIQPCKRGLLEITAYIIGGGTLEEARAVMLAKGCTQVYP